MSNVYQTADEFILDNKGCYNDFLSLDCRKCEYKIYNLKIKECSKNSYKLVMEKRIDKIKEVVYGYRK